MDKRLRFLKENIQVPEALWRSILRSKNYSDGNQDVRELKIYREKFQSFVYEETIDYLNFRRFLKNHVHLYGGRMYGSLRHITHSEIEQVFTSIRKERAEFQAQNFGGRFEAA